MLKASKMGAVLLAGCALFIIWRAGIPELQPANLDAELGARIAVPYPGGRLPPVETTTLDNTPIELNAEIGQPLILNFWATWCIPCVEEMPILEQLYQDGVLVIGINAGLEDPATVSAWIEQMGLSFPIIVDDEQRTIEAQYRVTGLPTTFFVDAEGVIRHIERGVLTEPSLIDGLVAMGIE